MCQSFDRLPFESTVSIKEKFAKRPQKRNANSAVTPSCQKKPKFDKKEIAQKKLRSVTAVAR